MPEPNDNNNIRLADAYSTTSAGRFYAWAPDRTALPKGMLNLAVGANKTRHPSVSRSRLKRFFDLMVASMALVFLAPLLIVCYVAVKLESPGPGIFRQTRGGLNGVPFEILKFRTMRVQPPGAPVHHATKSDPRVTRIGRFLRKSSIDELPQLFNVVKGEMSLVGPRPHALAHDDHYGAEVQDYEMRWLAKPGITGLAQISGLRGEIVSKECMIERVARDIEYIQEWSFIMDIRIILVTAARLFFDRKAY